MSTQPPEPPSTAPQGLTVLYDGACPLCRREIGLYQGLCAREAVHYVDISQPATPLPPGTTQAQLLARFHVQTADGHLLQGAAAFLALWARLPGWRCLAWLGALPGVSAVMDWAYAVFLRCRPALQRWARRWD